MSEEILDFGGLARHINTYTLWSSMKSVHPFHQTLTCFMTILGSGSKRCGKGCCTVNDNEDRKCSTSDFHIGMVNENNVAKIVSP